MPIYGFKCIACGKEFDKLLASLDMSSIRCSLCDSSDVKKKKSASINLNEKQSKSIPTGALSGASCKSGFS